MVEIREDNVNYDLVFNAWIITLILMLPFYHIVLPMVKKKKKKTYFACCEILIY